MLTWMLTLAFASAPSSAALGADMRPDRESQLPEQLVGVGIDEAIDVQVPRDLTFTNQDGKRVTLGSLFDRGKPTILTLNYTNCPLLCNVQLSGFVNALRAIEDDLGELFNVVTVSIDPEDDFKRAKQVLNRYEDDYGRPIGDHWQYLVATEKEIEAVTKAVGFGYHLDTETGEYQHTSALIVLGPEGKVSRYLYGVTYSPNTLRLTTIEAAQGKSASSLDQLILYCFKYDSKQGQYTPVVRNIMQLGAAVTVLLLGLLAGGAWLRKPSSSAE